MLVVSYHTSTKELSPEQLEVLTQFVYALHPEAECQSSVVSYHTSTKEYHLNSRKC